MATLPDLPQTEIAIVEMTNAFRKESRLGEVKPNAALTAAARAFAEYLAKTGKFAHEADGRQPAQRAEAAGYRYCLVAENLAMNLDSRGFETRALARAAVEGWKNSPGHRANMLQPTVTEIGVAVARAPDKDPKFISVQLFGRPEVAEGGVPDREPGGRGGALRAGRGDAHAARARDRHAYELRSRAADVREGRRRGASASRRATGTASWCARARAAPSRSASSGSRCPRCWGPVS